MIQNTEIQNIGYREKDIEYYLQNTEIPNI